MNKPFAHRARLTAVPAAGFMEVHKDPNEDVGAVPEYMPLSLLSSAPESGLVPVVLGGTPQDITGSGAGSVAVTKTNWTTGAGAAAGTLANGTVIGQTKTVLMVVDGGGDLTLTPASFADGTDITFADAGDAADLIWDGAAWNVVDLYNTVDGVSAPVVA